MKPFTPKILPLANIKWEKFVHLIGKANAEVARFDGLLDSLQNPGVLLSPLTTEEAVLSSRIEGTQATVEDVLKFEADPNKKVTKYHDIQEVLNYRKAMTYAVKRIEDIPLSLRLIKEMHEILLENTRGKNRNLGNFRTSQVWIGKPESKIEDATYIPPSPEKVIMYLDNLEKYIHQNEKDFLVQLAIVHAQFEIIHPFIDGNGRIGRIIMPLFLYCKKVLSSPVLYLSAYFEKYREEYYAKLLDISKNNNWEEWITYFLNAIAIQSKENIKKAKSILQLYETKKNRIVGLTHSQFATKTLDFLFSTPIFKSKDFIKETNIPKASALRIIKLLVDGGVLETYGTGTGRGGYIYFFKKLIDIIS